MKVLFTGASSSLGTAVLSHLLRSATFEEVACTVHRRTIPLQSPKLRQQVLDLTGDFRIDAALPHIDLLIHFAAITHARDPRLYRAVNVEGSLKLIEQSRERGCRNMFYVSTRCVGPKEPKRSCGAYGESKRALEDALLEMEWDSLLVLRPAEVYGAGGTEGIDQLIHLARTLHVVPMIFGDRRLLRAAALQGTSVRIVTSCWTPCPAGPIYELCGPEVLEVVPRKETKKASRSFRAFPSLFGDDRSRPRCSDAAYRGQFALIASDQIDPPPWRTMLRSQRIRVSLCERHTGTLRSCSAGLEARCADLKVRTTCC